MTAIEMQIKNSPSVTHCNKSTKTSLTDLVLEMKHLGLDPAPLLSVAAGDFLRRSGPDARLQAKHLYHRAQEHQDQDGMYFWHEIYALLEQIPLCPA
ncbi:hypothetical protein [Luteithermobacter gelatinilyticus]|uniref:hypothetical protein n=1 Tax=Luteithermobacter gelatinilyticus TaxID=2582913 RepID=UPI00110733E7|nr:hypothetical protein [Luteithermobacter gelatinilyticus]